VKKRRPSNSPNHHRETVARFARNVLSPVEMIAFPTAPFAPDPEDVHVRQTSPYRTVRPPGNPIPSIAMPAIPQFRFIKEKT
jgi:hypothetical protein